MSAINEDRLNYRTMKWKYIYLNLILISVVGIILSLLCSGTIVLVIIPICTTTFGWQMGILSERNEWHKEAN